MMYSLIAAAAAVLLEYLYRVLPGTWWHWAWLYAIPSLVVSYCINKMITVPGQPLIGALILWTFAVLGMRVFVSTIILRDHIPAGTWVALGLIVVACFVQVTWK